MSPFVSVGYEQAIHVDQSTKEKNWSKEYIEFSKLLQSEFEHTNEQKGSIVNGQITI